MSSRRPPKLGPGYDADPISLGEYYVPEDVPTVIKDDSEYRTLTWMLIRIYTVKYAREKLHETVSWPSAEKIMENRISILDILKGIVTDYDVVLEAYNQFVKDYASIACLQSVYTYAAYLTWIAANSVELEFDRAIYHYTGYRICSSI